MLTLFTPAKPFTGQIATLQRNALKSWKLLDSHVEVIVLAMRTVRRKSVPSLACGTSHTWSGTKAERNI